MAVWSAARWWPSPDLLDPDYREPLNGELEGISRVEARWKGAQKGSRSFYLPFSSEYGIDCSAVDFANHELLSRWWRVAGLAVPNESPLLLSCNSSNPTVRWGNYFVKYRIDPFCSSAVRERRFYRRLASSDGGRLTPRLLGECGLVAGEPIVLVLEWVKGATLWDLLSGLSPEERNQQLPAALLSSAELLGRFHRRLGAGFDDSGAVGWFHADAHLAQLLQSVTGELLLVDFEGLPEQESGDRGELLDDLAALWRSGDYLLSQKQEPVEPLLNLSFARLLLERWSEAVGGATEKEWKRISGREQLRQFVAAVGRRNRWELEYEGERRPGWLAIPRAGWSRTQALLLELE